MKLLKNFIIFVIVAIVLYLACKFLPPTIVIALFVLGFLYTFYYKFKNSKKAPKTRTFVIKKGKRYATGHILGLFNFRIIFNQAISFKFEFNESALYDDLFENGVNKLFGFKQGVFGIHKNSIRIGWKANKKEVLIYSYSYIDGIRVIKVLPMKIKLNKEYKVNLFELTDRYIIVIDDGITKYEHNVLREKRDIVGIRFLSFPYFGGKCKAPHNINIKLTY